MRAVILVEDGVQDQELFPVVDRLVEESIIVDIASPTIAGRKGKYGIPFQPTITTSELVVSNYDIVVVPGGWESPEKIRQDKYSLDFVRFMNERGKIIASQCHGPWVLISAGIMKDRKATCYKGMKDDLINAGCEYIDTNLVVDRNIITVPHYRNNPEFMRAIINFL